ncbi:MAG TPA: type II toxin-antitoxin system HicA family toxin [Phycisphaerae bacterium]|nr:type II toxin-antitoxin system HicA family toxin [Phycisphaerae bacterium]
MKLPRDLSGPDLVKALARLGYEVDHQTGGHVRLTTQRGGEHHLTIPAHEAIKIGTLSAILRSVADHLALSRDELLRELFGQASK